MEHLPSGRLLNGKVYTPPNLDSPLAVHGDSGALKVGNARLHTQPQPMWLVAQELDSASQTYVAVNPTGQATLVTLQTPAGTVSASSWAIGRLEWQTADQVLVVYGLQEPDNLTVPDGVRVELRQTLF